ncbi:MAG: class I SAM-dependent methyltransferase [Rhodospirillales bacterium]
MDFYQHYNRLYAAKDYVAEAAVVLRLLTDGSGQECHRLLEVGCGTGNHSRAFAAHNISVTAVDTDDDMIASARNAGPHDRVTFITGPVEQVPPGEFDGAAAMFNVVNYVTDRASLLSMFQAIVTRLHPSSSFVFDCWNGVAALIDPPRNEVRDFRSGGWAYHVDMRAVSDPMRQLVEVCNQFEAEGPDGEIQHFSNRLVHRLWTPAELTDIATEAGFASVRFMCWMAPDEAATDGDWKIMAVARCGVR